MDTRTAPACLTLETGQPWHPLTERGQPASGLLEGDQPAALETIAHSAERHGIDLWYLGAYAPTDAASDWDADQAEETDAFFTALDARLRPERSEWDASPLILAVIDDQPALERYPASLYAMALVGASTGTGVLAHGQPSGPLRDVLTSYQQA